MSIPKRACRTAVATILALGAAASASATESGFYLGFNYGESSFSIDDAELGIFDVTTSSSTDDSDSAYSLSAGYRFNPYVGLELSYLDLGEVKIVETGRDIFPVRTGRVEASIGASGIALAVVGSIPVNKFEFFGKLGMMFAKTEIDAAVTLTQAGITGTGSDGTSADTTEVMAGLGIGYTFGEHVHLKLEWTNLPKVGDEEETGEGDVSLLSAGIQFRF